MSATYCAKRPYLLEMVGGAPIGTAADKPYRRPLGPLTGARLDRQLDQRSGRCGN